MRNITVTVDDETYRRARVRAAEGDTSVSALVKGFLLDLVGETSKADRLKREELRLRETILAFRASDRLDRDDLHARDL